MYRFLTGIVVGAFVFVAVFGLLGLLSHTEHHVGCPLQGAQVVMCESTTIEHFSIWQALFASVLGFLVLVGAILFIVARVPDALRAHERLRVRVFALVSHRPLLFQELYSRGIHNRKEPYAFS